MIKRLTLSLAIGGAAAWMGLTQVASAQDAAVAVETSSNNVRSGDWSLGPRWIQTDGATEYGAVIADHPESRLYQLCRTGTSTAGTGSSELDVYINTQLETGIRSYSLDIGSCILTPASKLAVRYDGADARVTRVLFGTFAELVPETLAPFGYQQISRWTLQWDRGVVNPHSVVLVNGIEGHYQICFNGGEVSPTGTTERPNFVTLRMQVDGAYIRAFGSMVAYAANTCTNVSGSRIVIEPNTFSPGLNFYKLQGTISRRVDPSETG